MQGPAEAFNEELAVTEHGTATTSDGQLTVGLRSKLIWDAEVTVALASGTSRDEKLGPGQSIRVDATGYSYLVTLVSLTDGGIRVRVTRSEIGQPTPVGEPPSQVQIVETETSCLAELERIVDNALAGRRVKTKWDSKGPRIVERGLWGSDLIKISYGYGAIFWNGRWSRLGIEVFAESYLAPAKAIADAYSARTGVEVTIYKKF